MPVNMPITEKISQGTSGNKNFRLLVSELGDGQKQVAPDGLNHIREMYTVEWTGLTLIERDTVLTALDDTGGWDVLLWAPYGDVSTRKWRITEGYAYNSQGGDVWSVTTEIEEDFRP